MNAGPRTRRLWAALLALLVGAGLLAAIGVDASLAGAWDKRAYGCVCHTPVANASVQVEVTGFPPRYDLGGAYTIEVRLVSTPVNSSSDRRGGFNAEVSQGALSIPAALDAVEQAYGNQASHRDPGTNRTNWTITWLAPSAPSGVATLWVTVNTVNGNGVPDGGDLWTQVRFESAGPSPDTSGGLGGLLGGPGGGAVLLVALGGAAGAAGTLALVLVRRRGRDGRGSPRKKRLPRRRRRKKPPVAPPHSRGRSR